MNTTETTTTHEHDLVHEDQHHDAITRIVALALDYSEHSQHALDYAIKNILKPETDLVILLNCRQPAVVPGPYGSAYMDFSNYIVQLEEQNRTASHTLLRKAAAQLKQDKFAVKAISLRGDAREELTRKVQELNVDLLVIGSRGLGTMKRLFIGSVSDHLVHHVHCPVLLVKNTQVHEHEYGQQENQNITPASLH